MCQKQSTAGRQHCWWTCLLTVSIPSIAGTASGRLVSRQREAEDIRCDTQTDNCHSKATLHRPCILDRTPCVHRPLSPEVHSPPNISRQQLAYLVTDTDSLGEDNTCEHCLTLCYLFHCYWCCFSLFNFLH